MAIYFKIVSVVCKAVPTECTEDKMHIFLQAFSCWPKYRKGLRKDRFNLHDTNQKKQARKDGSESYILFSPKRGVVQSTFFTANRIQSDCKGMSMGAAKQQLYSPATKFSKLESHFLDSQTEPQALSLIGVTKKMRAIKIITWL